jgi:hypothetical protein
MPDLHACFMCVFVRPCPTLMSYIRIRCCSMSVATNSIAASLEYLRRARSKSLKHMDKQHLSVDGFEHLKSFLDRNTAFKLYSTGKTFKSIVKKSFSGLLLRLAMEQVNEKKPFRKLKYLSGGGCPMQKHNFLHVMHELTRVLQNGLNLHQRAPGPSDVHARYVANQRRLESATRRAIINSLPVYVKSTWHLSLLNVGILMVTRRLLEHAPWRMQLLKNQARQAAHGRRIRCQLLRCIHCLREIETPIHHCSRFPLSSR